MTLQISNLSKRYGNNWVFRDVSLSVASGRILAVLGPISAGKTTLLRVIAGVESPSPAGKIVEIGRKIDLVSAETGSKGFLQLLQKRTTNSDRLEQFRNAISTPFDILLLDDPLAGVDPTTRENELSDLKRRAAQLGADVIYATNDFETAALVADEIAVLCDGYIQQTGTPEQLYESPVSTAVAQITGRCNIIRARRLTSTKFEIPEFQSLDGGHRLFTEKADIAKLGAINRNASLAIRPESISMSFGASFPEDNLIKAVVTTVKYLGPATIVELDGGGLRLEAMVFRLVGLDVGQECMLGLPPERIKILSD